jgi:membrane protein DedA with SNARE-associated domain
VPVASITSFVGGHGIYAVFALMVAAAVIPAASELVMIYAGAVAAGAFASAHVVLFGHRISTPAWAFVTMALTGVVGNLVGAVAGWLVGRYGGRPLLESRGRWIHVTPEKLDRAERWFERYGLLTVAAGFATPGLRSFVAIPAGIVEMPLARFVPLAAAGCLAFCFGLAGGGWALGRSYNSLHHDLSYVYIVVAVAAVAVIAYAVLRRRSQRPARRADPAR